MSVLGMFSVSTAVTYTGKLANPLALAASKIGWNVTVNVTQVSAHAVNVQVSGGVTRFPPTSSISWELS